MGVEPITPTLQGSVAPNGMPALEATKETEQQMGLVFSEMSDQGGGRTHKIAALSTRPLFRFAYLVG